jgi:hypothetical protein
MTTFISKRTLVVHAVRRYEGTVPLTCCGRRLDGREYQESDDERDPVSCGQCRRTLRRWRRFGVIS